MIALALLLAHVAPFQAETVKAEILGGYIYVNVKVNGVPARFVVDTGAQMNVVVPAAAEKLGVTGGTPVQAGGAGSKRVSARLTKVKTLSVGNCEVQDTNVVVVPLPGGLDCDGLVGRGFLDKFAMTVNYDDQTVTFVDPDQLKIDERSTVLSLRIEQGLPAAEFSVEGVTGWATLDTGAGGTMSLHTSFVEENRLRDRFPNRVAAVTGKGVGGTVRGELARVGSLKLGPFSFPPLVLDLSTETSGAMARKGLIGNAGYDVLSRFVVTFDFKGKRLVLQKGKRFGAPSVLNRAGFTIDFDGKTFTVIDVIPKTPAADEGVLVGDELIELDGKPVADLTAMKVRTATRRPSGTVMKAKFKRPDGNIRSVSLRLRDWI